MNRMVVVLLVLLPVTTMTLAWLYYVLGSKSPATLSRRRGALAAFLGLLAGLLCDAFMLGVFDEVLGLTGYIM